MILLNSELAALLAYQPPDARVVAICEDGMPMNIVKVQAETHTDADGSTTVWLHIKEY